MAQPIKRVSADKRNGVSNEIIETQFKKIIGAKKGNAGVGTLFYGIIAVLVAITFVVTMLPTIRASIENGNLTDGDKALLYIIPVLIVVGVVMLGVKAVGIGKH